MSASDSTSLGNPALDGSSNNLETKLDLQIFTTTTGRIGRRTLWLTLLVLAVPASILRFSLLAVLGRTLLPDPNELSNPDSLQGAMRDTAFVELIVLLVFFYPSYVTMQKRLNDRNRPSWMAKLFLAAPVLLALMNVLGMGFTAAKSSIGMAMPTPTTIGWLLGTLVGIVEIWAVVECGYLRGTVGPNRFGPDPLARG